MKLPPCLGVRVTYSEKQRVIADSRGLGRFRRVVVGPAFFLFPPREQQAILLHEVAHCKMKHLEQRMRSLWMVFVRPLKLRDLCIEQEHAADRFVAGCGFGPDLARAFGRLRKTRALLHPPVADRITRLLSRS